MNPAKIMWSSPLNGPVVVFSKVRFLWKLDRITPSNGSNHSGYGKVPLSCKSWHYSLDVATKQSHSEHFYSSALPSAYNWQQSAFSSSGKNITGANLPPNFADLLQIIWKHTYLENQSTTWSVARF